MAASNAVRELDWIKRLIDELYSKINVVLYMDNESAIKLIKNPEFHKRSKHINLRYHFIREEFDAKVFDLKHNGRLLWATSLPALFDSWATRLMTELYSFC